MDNITIRRNKRITINDDPEKVIEFNPSDVIFVERFYDVYREFAEKQKEFDLRSTVISEEKETDMAENAQHGIEFLKEACTFVRLKIDYLFGDGTSEMVFGDALSLDMYQQFFEGIMPFVVEDRNKKVNKYSVTPDGKVMK